MKAKLVLHLGPRKIAVGNRVLGKCDDLSFSVVEATDEEIKILRAAYEIRVLKIPKEEKS